MLINPGEDEFALNWNKEVFERPREMLDDGQEQEH
jgi:hypothetical protein